MSHQPPPGPNEILDSGKPCRGVPPDPQTDRHTDAERRDIERRVFTERTRRDKDAEEALAKRHQKGERP